MNAKIYKVKIKIARSIILKKRLVLLLMNVTTSRRKGRHLTSSNSACADADTTGHIIWRLENRMRLHQLLFTAFALKVLPLVLLNFSLLFEFLHFLLFLHLFLLEIFLVVGSNALAGWWKHFNAHFVLAEILQVCLTFVLIVIENYTHVAFDFVDRLDGGLVESSMSRNAIEIGINLKP